MYKQISSYSEVNHNRNCRIEREVITSDHKARAGEITKLISKYNTQNEMSPSWLETLNTINSSQIGDRPIPCADINSNLNAIEDYIGINNEAVM